MSGPIRQGVPVQRPLARQLVMLSSRVIAYYGLICASRPHPPLYELCSGPSPDGLLWAGSERVPIFLCLSLLFVPSSVPRWMERLLLVVLTTPANLPPSQHRVGIHFVTIDGSQVNGVTRLQSSLYATARKDCSPFTDKGFYVRAFTSRVASKRRRI